MIKKLLNLTIISLGMYQLCQAYTWTVYNKTDLDLEVTLTLEDLSYGKPKTKNIAQNQIEKFEFKGALAGYCLWQISAKKTMYKGNHKTQVNVLPHRKLKGICGPRNILIFKEGNNVNWKFVSNKNFK